MVKYRWTYFFETVAWLFIAAIFFAYSFEFDQDIEIYKFNATGWPRTILICLVFVTLGNCFYLFRKGNVTQVGRVGFSSEEDNEDSKNSKSSVFKILGILFTPFLFAYSLKPIGFYSATPIFIIVIIVLLGERRLKWIVGITFVIYIILLTLFTVVLNAPLPQGYVSPFYDISGVILKWKTQLETILPW
jgi:hypothetical protein